MHYCKHRESFLSIFAVFDLRGSDKSARSFWTSVDMTLALTSPHVYKFNEGPLR